MNDVYSNRAGWWRSSCATELMSDNSLTVRVRLSGSPKFPFSSASSFLFVHFCLTWNFRVSVSKHWLLNICWSPDRRQIGSIWFSAFWQIDDVIYNPVTTSRSIKYCSVAHCTDVQVHFKNNMNTNNSKLQLLMALSVNLTYPLFVLIIEL